jgi:hypothetical protein
MKDEYMTLRQLFEEHGIDRQHEVSFMQIANSKRELLTKETRINWCGMGWDRVDEAFYELNEEGTLWCYGASAGNQFLFLKKDKEKVESILGIAEGNEDWKLNATNSRR